jgi:hypothetical protein
VDGRAVQVVGTTSTYKTFFAVQRRVFVWITEGANGAQVSWVQAAWSSCLNEGEVCM